MAFLRVKRIKGREYCYLVENRWSRRKGVRQRVKAYLGPVVRLPGAGPGFREFHRTQPETLLSGKDPAAIVRDVIRGELERAGFVQDRTVCRKAAGSDTLFFNLQTHKALRNGQEIVLALNDGYLCRFTVRRILAFDASGDAAVDSMPFARLLVDAGLSPPPAIAAALYQMLGK